MLLPISEKCNTFSSTSPLPSRYMAETLAKDQALNRATASAMANSTAAWIRSPWDFRLGGLNLMKDVQRVNRQNIAAARSARLLGSRSLNVRTGGGDLPFAGVRSGLTKAQRCEQMSEGVTVLPLKGGGAAQQPMPEVTTNQGLGQTTPYNGPYPVSCAPSSENPLNQITLSDISPWWWVAGGILLLLIAGSTEGPATQRRTRRAA